MFTLGLGALTALSKSKKHFVGLTWADGDKKGGFAIQCDKNDYRGILAGLEGISGKKAVDSEAMTVKNLAFFETEERRPGAPFLRVLCARVGFHGPCLRGLFSDAI